MLDVQRGSEEDRASSYIDAQGTLTSQQARTFAAELIEAAGRLDVITTQS